MCIGFHSKETAKGPAISSLETRDLETNAHASNYSNIKARSSRAFKSGDTGSDERFIFNILSLTYKKGLSSNYVEEWLRPGI